MSTERRQRTLSGTCPICSAAVAPAGPVEDTEILACPECQSLLVVGGRAEGGLILREAPRVEEDWGE